MLSERYDEALTYFSRCGEDATALHHIGLVFCRRLEYDMALDVLERSPDIEGDPNVVAAKGNAYVGKGNVKEGLRLLEVARKGQEQGNGR